LTCFSLACLFSTATLSVSVPDRFSGPSLAVPDWPLTLSHFLCSTCLWSTWLLAATLVRWTVRQKQPCSVVHVKEAASLLFMTVHWLGADDHHLHVLQNMDCRAHRHGGLHRTCCACPCSLWLLCTLLCLPCLVRPLLTLFLCSFFFFTAAPVRTSTLSGRPPCVQASTLPQLLHGARVVLAFPHARSSSARPSEPLVAPPAKPARDFASPLHLAAVAPPTSSRLSSLWPRPPAPEPRYVPYATATREHAPRCRAGSSLSLARARA